MINLFIGGKFMKPSSGLYSNDIALSDEADLQRAIDSAKKSVAPDTNEIRRNILEFADIFEKEKNNFISELKFLGTSKDDFDDALKSIYFYAGMVDKWKVLYITGSDYKFISIKSPVIYNLKGNLSLTHIVSSVFRPLQAGASVVIAVPPEWGKIANMLSLIFLNTDLPAGTVNILTGLKSENKNIIEINFSEKVRSLPTYESEKTFFHDIIITKKIQI